MHPLAAQIILKVCSCSPETEFDPNCGPNIDSQCHTRIWFPNLSRLPAGLFRHTEVFTVCRYTEPRLQWFYLDLSPVMTKPTKWLCTQRRLQISLGIRPVWSESSLCAQRVAKGPSFHHADSEYSDQTGRMPKADLSLRWTHSHFVGFFVLRLICMFPVITLTA